MINEIRAAFSELHEYPWSYLRSHSKLVFRVRNPSVYDLHRPTDAKSDQPRFRSITTKCRVSNTLSWKISQDGKTEYERMLDTEYVSASNLHPRSQVD